MEAQLTLAPWEVVASQENECTGAVNAVHRVHLEGETRPVRVRFAPDVRGQFLMFLKREDDEREGCWTVRDRHRIEVKRFKAPYSPELQTVRRAIGESLGRVFHFENLDKRLGDERFKGVWRAWMGVNGMGSWTSLSRSAPEIVNWNSSSEPQFVFQLAPWPQDWKKQSAVQWREALEEELHQPDSDVRFALDFACSSREEQENARLRLARGTAHQLRTVLRWLVQTHEAFWPTRARLWEVSESGGGDFSYSGGGSGDDEIWEFVNCPAILSQWGEFVFGKMGVSLDNSLHERHLCLQEKFCHFYDSIFELRVEAPSQHEKMEAFLGIKAWVEEFAPADGAWLLPS